MYEAEIQAGAEFLDEETPGWELRIDPSSLDLNSQCYCVLGQLYGDFWGFVSTRWSSVGEWHNTHQLGFLGEGQTDPEFKILTQEWITFIKQRLNEGVDIGSDVLAPTV